MPGTTEASTRAMGTTCRVTVVGGPPGLADAALRLVQDLERRWSRFRDDSELSRLNRAGGVPCIVSADTFDLVEHLVRAWRETGGRFDPTVHDAVVGLGYDRSLPTGTVDGAVRDVPAPGCDGVRLDRRTRLVWLPPGIRLDAGGLGKGLAADVVAGEVLAAGAAGVLVDLGGDLRAAGDGPDGPTWRLGVEHPGAPGTHLARVETRDGGVATTSRRRRRWQLADGTAVHHVVDPHRGRPGEVPWTSATALAASAVDAEVGATVTFLDGDPAGAPRVVAAVLADELGRTRVLGPHPELVATGTPAAA